MNSITELNLYRACTELFCQKCIFDSSLQVSWKEQVEGCTSRNCPLHPIRIRGLYICSKAVHYDEVRDA